MKSKPLLTVYYKDIPWEEAMQCQPIGVAKDFNWETMARGKAIQIESGPVTFNNSNLRCRGPFYFIVNGPMKGYLACPHIANIGD